MLTLKMFFVPTLFVKVSFMPKFIDHVELLKVFKSPQAANVSMYICTCFVKNCLYHNIGFTDCVCVLSFIFVHIVH
jgi:hypothetical protein